MWSRVSILALVVLIVALPFVFRPAGGDAGGAPGDPLLVVVTPHTEATRYEFARAFAAWHRARYGQGVRVDWRVIGGTTEIMRYLEAEYVAAFRTWWMHQGRTWPMGGAEMVLDRRFNPSQPPAGVADDPARLAAWEQQRELHAAFRQTDDAAAFTCKIDVLFGGGAFDHSRASAAGLLVPAWAPDQVPPGLLATADGRELIPASLGGEVWRSPTFYGAALSTFGICYNVDRLADLGVTTPPHRWVDLTAPALCGQVGVADPTKSGSIAKAFEMIVHEQCWEAVRGAGYTVADVARFEAEVQRAGLAPGIMPAGVPQAYQSAMESGWVRGVRLVQLIGANARYFTDSASKVAIDVSMGDAAAGLAIDFYGRYQAEMSRSPAGRERMVYVTPAGGSSVSADPVGLLRGAEHAELARHFVEFVLSEDGQRLWNYRPGTPGGPDKYALRRLPIRRDFYPAVATNAPTSYERHRAFFSDDLGNPANNPYVLGEAFVYQPRWTGSHFNVFRDLIRAMCMDSGDELRRAWRAILAAGGPEQQVAALAQLQRLPDLPAPLTWTSALSIPRTHARIDYMREWTLFFRRSYAEAEAKVSVVE
ncbi:MAG: ABC transporter substrate-binding protein [Lentisphaerae bacterium]|nr:ABC transporter substrate-binding protein [Lentisphaerota bacterium]